MKPVIDLKNLNFSYGNSPVFAGLSLQIPQHSCTLILGANGIGKSTLLRILAGKHLIAHEACKVLDKNPFSEGLGLEEFSLVAEKLDLNLDLEVRELLAGMKRSGPGRIFIDNQAELLDLLEIDLSWRMHQVSNGQRRRVDLLLSLIYKSPQLLLLDEVTSDLDILSRQRLLRWLKAKTKSQKMSVVFATHILDGMLEWMDHLVFLSPSSHQKRLAEVRLSLSTSELQKTKIWKEAEIKNPHQPLLWLAEHWLMEDRKPSADFRKLEKE